ncbi:MAG: hypothetical protein LC798_04700 [Chloroflexi bacterium]|nr:hypothetical protein [Chloroflexota bacterium]
MRIYLSRLVLLMMLVGSMLLLSAGSVAAHCVQTPVGHVDLAPGHFAAAGGHNSAILHSGGTVGLCDRTSPELNAAAPDNNPG